MSNQVVLVKVVDHLDNENQRAGISEYTTTKTHFVRKYSMRISPEKIAQEILREVPANAFRIINPVSVVEMSPLSVLTQPEHVTRICIAFIDADCKDEIEKALNDPDDYLDDVQTIDTEEKVRDFSAHFSALYHKTLNG